MTAVAEVMQACPGIVQRRSRTGARGPLRGRPRAGAAWDGGDRWAPPAGTHAPFKIPDACAHFGIPWLNWFGFLREVGWQL